MNEETEIPDDVQDSTPTARDRFDQLYEQLRMRISLLDYPPGMRLSETELATEYGISRTPLRRVLVRLESERLVKSVHGVGTFVTDVNLIDLKQTYALRMELSELVGKLEPVPPSLNLMQRLQDLATNVEALAKAPAPRSFAKLNMVFFLARLELTANLPLREICERLYFQTTRIWLKSSFTSEFDLFEEVNVFNREVQEVMAALAIGDLQAAAHIQRAHISMSYMRLLRQMELRP